MKKLILILALLFISNSLFSTPQDSCLKMIWGDDEVYYDTEFHHWVGSSNPDSVRVDSCIGSPTYGKLFAKRYFDLQFHPNYYPFDTVLKPDTIKGVSDISNSKADFKIILQQLEAQFGTIYFLGRPDEEIDTIFYGNPGCRIFFADYQDIDEIVGTFSLSIDTLKWMAYGNRAKMPVSVGDLTQEEKPVIIFPNPVRNFLELKVLSGVAFSELYIHNFQGDTVLYTEFREKIDLSFLPSGIYFLKLGNYTYKFIKE